MLRGRAPAWLRLMGHSHRLALGWLARGARGGWAHPRAGLYRILVPLEPWRYYELARVAREPFAGRCLDVGSPKLLASLLRREGRGDWVAIDLFSEEIERWRALDPALDLRVEDARALSFPDGHFDAVACVSVIEHIPDDGDARAMAEIWRVLRPGGVLHLTTNLAPRAREVRVGRAIYGEASEGEPGWIFFERHYSPESLRERLLGLPWQELERELVRERRPVHRRFFAARPLSFLAGNLLPLACARNFVRIDGPEGLGDREHAALYLRLAKPASADGAGAAKEGEPGSCNP